MSGDMVEVAAATESPAERGGVAQISCDSFNWKTVKVPQVGILSR